MMWHMFGSIYMLFLSTQSQLFKEIYKNPNLSSYNRTYLQDVSKTFEISRSSLDGYFMVQEQIYKQKNILEQLEFRWDVNYSHPNDNYHESQKNLDEITFKYRYIRRTAIINFRDAFNILIKFQNMPV